MGDSSTPLGCPGPGPPSSLDGSTPTEEAGLGPLAAAHGQKWAQGRGRRQCRGGETWDSGVPGRLGGCPQLGPQHPGLSPGRTPPLVLCTHPDPEAAGFLLRPHFRLRGAEGPAAGTEHPPREPVVEGLWAVASSLWPCFPFLQRGRIPLAAVRSHSGTVWENLGARSGGQRPAGQGAS